MAGAENVFAVYLVYGTEHRDRGLQLLRALLRRAFPRARTHIVAVDNAIDGAFEQRLPDGSDLIAGDNREREFSGYEKGLRFLETRDGLGSPGDAVLIANDTFHRSYGLSYLLGFSRARARRALDDHAILGHIDRYPKSVAFNNEPFQHWIRSSFFLLDHGTLEKLRPLTLAHGDDELFSEDPRRFFKHQGALDETYQRYLRTWLFEATPPDADFPHRWHSKVPLSDETYPMLKAKARCVLAEHQLSRRAIGCGIPLHCIDAGPIHRTLERSLASANAPLPFLCNICGAPCMGRIRRFDREQSSCWCCRSNLRFRSLLRVLSLRLYGQSMALPRFPREPHFAGLGLSDWHGYAVRLASVHDYQNSFLHQEPRLDIVAIPSERESSLDYLISSDVFEHVRPPVAVAFENSFRLLKPGGCLILTVPYTLEADTHEHYPDLHDFRIEHGAPGPVLINQSRDGEEQRFSNLVFHGGPGQNLELRVFSKDALLRHLENAGFVDIRVHDESDLKFGIFHGQRWSLPISALKPPSTGRNFRRGLL